MLRFRSGRTFQNCTHCSRRGFLSAGTLGIAGLSLPEHHVYSHKQPLVLGGEDSVENYEATDVRLHLSLMGQIHEQVKDLPEGTPIGEIEIKDP